MLTPIPELEDIIAALPNYGPVDSMRKALWKSLRLIRNHVIHDGKMPGPEAQLLIDEVNKLESDIAARIE